VVKNVLCHTGRNFETEIRQTSTLLFDWQVLGRMKLCQGWRGVSYRHIHAHSSAHIRPQQQKDDMKVGWPVAPRIMHRGVLSARTGLLGTSLCGDIACT